MAEELPELQVHHCGWQSLKHFASMELSSSTFRLSTSIVVVCGSELHDLNLKFMKNSTPFDFQLAGTL